MAAFLASAAVMVGAGPLAPDRLRLEYMLEPKGVDVSYPARFSWSLVHTERGQAQTAYQVVVRTAGAGGKIFWDSSKMASNVSQNVPIGATLPADSSYTWTVQYWDSAGNPSPESAPATFTTGLMADSDWKGAKWVGGGMGQYRKEFPAAKGEVTRASIYVVGLGYYKLHVNGQKV